MSVFDTPQDHINWAKSRLEIAEALFRRYAQSDAFANVTEFDANTGEELRIIRLVTPLPPDITGLLRNALVDTKHSFDQSLFAAARATGGVRFDKNYPWANTFFGVKGIIEKRQRQKNSALPQFIVDEIFRQEPHGTGPGFSGGNDLIRDLAKMVNDKHSIGFRVTASITAFSARNMSFSGTGSLISGWDPVKQQMELARMQPGSSFSYQDCTVSSDVFFKRAGNIGKVPALSAAREFVNRAQIVLEGFKAVCT